MEQHTPHVAVGSWLLTSRHLNILVWGGIAFMLLALALAEFICVRLDMSLGMMLSLILGMNTSCIVVSSLIWLTRPIEGTRRSFSTALSIMLSIALVSSFGVGVIRTSQDEQLARDSALEHIRSLSTQPEGDRDGAAPEWPQSASP